MKIDSLSILSAIKKQNWYQTHQKALKQIEHIQPILIHWLQRTHPSLMAPLDCHAYHVDNDTLYINASNASIASYIRHRKSELLALLHKNAFIAIKKIYLSVENLNQQNKKTAKKAFFATGTGKEEHTNNQSNQVENQLKKVQIVDGLQQTAKTIKNEELARALIKLSHTLEQ